MPACGACAAPDAPSLCGACRAAAYCGPACQRAAWATHKPACKAIAAAVAEDVAGEAAGGGDPVRTACDGCGAPLGDADNRCLGCRFPSYCGQACQVAHWRAAHGVVCKAVGAAKFARTMARAAAGDAAAMHGAALCYADGTGVAQDECEAFA